MRKTVPITFVLLIVGAFIVLGENADLSKFKYQREINVDCNNFLGYAKFEANNDILSKSKNLQNIYIDSGYYIEYGSSSENSDWFVKNSNVKDLESLNVILDEDVGTYYVISKPQSRLDVELKNPTIQKFDRIVVTLKDSELNNIEFYDNNVKLNPIVIKNNFRYVYLFDQKIFTNELRMQILFDSILKVTEIEFIESSGKNYIYFFVNDDCKRTYKLYYGDFGGSFVASQQHDAGKVLTAKLSEEKLNPDYDKDFDEDNVINEDDNCISVKNSDQKDINYNGVGDACEDFDNDGVINIDDNCPDKYDPNQPDTDKDGVGDACDTADNRFSEQNKWFFYVVAIIIVALFGFIGYKLFKKR